MVNIVVPKIKEKQKKQSIKLRNKNKSQKNILTSNHSISINDDIIMKDENINPNIISKVYSTNTNNTINALNRSTNKMIEDVEMKIENTNISEKKEIKNINVQNVDEYFGDICKEFFTHEEKYLVKPQYMDKQSDINFRMRAILIDW